MISIIVSKQNSRYCGFELNGHAGFKRYGKDIVCAAVSALVINTVNSIEKFTEDDCIIEAAPDGGHIKMTTDGDNSSELKLLLDSMCLGLEQIQKQYGSKYVELLYKEV